MPSAPNADSPFMDSRLQATFGVRAPGSPSSAGKPGVQVADVSFPAPPAPATAPPGRPSEGGSPAPIPTPAPIAAPAPKPAPAPQRAGGEMWPDARAKSTANVGGEMWPDAQGGGSAKVGGEMWPDVAAPAAPAAPTAPPLVVPTVTALNQPQLAITPEGEQKYRESVVRTREALGPMPNIFRNPAMPEMPVEPGKQNYNPFTGRWST